MRKLGGSSRMLVAAVALAVLAVTLGFSLGGLAVALGASVGTLAAGVYTWAFLKSHLSQPPRESVFDRRLATGAGLRLATAAVTGAAMFLVGRQAFLAYLAAFGAAFAVLLLLQAPRVLRQLEGLWLDDGRETS